MTAREETVGIRHDAEDRRFVTPTEHGEAVLTYDRADERTLDYRSTVVPEPDRGRGIGERLVLHALDWARENDYRVIPSCPFVKRVLERHPERRSARG